MKPAPTPRDPVIWKAILVAGLIAGTADLIFASFYYANGHPDPVHVGQMVAGGIYGISTFQHGMESAAVGWFFHYLIAFIWSAIFMLAAGTWPWLRKHPVAGGTLFGGFIYLLMKMVVLPLSAYHSKGWPISVAAGAIAIHLFGIGLPMGLAARRYLRGAV